MRLGFRIERPIKIGLVGLSVAWPTNGMLLVIGIDTASCKDGAVDVLEEAAVGQIEGTDNVAANRLLLVILAPVDIGTSSATGTVENVSWLDLLEFCDDGLPVLHTNGGGENLLALTLQKGLEMTRNPPLTSPDEVDRVFGQCTGSSHVEKMRCLIGKDMRSDQS